MEPTDGCAADPVVRGGVAAGDETAAADVMPEPVRALVFEGLCLTLIAMARKREGVAA